MNISAPETQAAGDRTGAPAASPPRARNHLRPESKRIATTEIIRSAVSVASIQPCAAVSGFLVMTRKLSVIESQPAARVVVATKASGRSVVQAYRALPEFTRIVVATHSATEARSWFATPNIGQIVEIDPFQIREAQPRTIASVVAQAPGCQS